MILTASTILYNFTDGIEPGLNDHMWLQVKRAMIQYAKEAIKEDRKNVAKHAQMYCKDVQAGTGKVLDEGYTDFFKADVERGIVINASVDKNSIINAPQIELK